MSLAPEELRRKHILTLEVCQRLVDENSRLKRCGASLPPDEKPPDADNSAALEELNRLKEMVRSLENRCKTAEQKEAYLEAELLSQRSLHTIKVSRLEGSLGEAQQCREEAESEVDRLRADNARLEQSAEDREIELDDLRNRCVGLSKQVALYEEELLADRSHAAGAAEESALALKELSEEGKVRAETARVNLAEKQKLESAIGKAAAEASLNHAEIERLRAQNEALEVELRRLSALCAQKQHSPLPSPQAATPTEPLPSVQALVTGKVVPPETTGAYGRPPFAGRAAASAEAAEKRRFQEFAYLRKENQQLRRQIEGLQALQSRTSMVLSKRTSATNLGSSLPKAKAPGGR